MDAFEYTGYWWLPHDEERKVPGTVAFSDAEGIELRLVGSFKDFQQMHQPAHYNIVLGLTVEGKVVTLLGCDETNSQLTGPGLLTQRVNAQTALLGAHFDALHDLLFCRAVSQYAYLADWADVSGFVPEWTTLGQELNDFEVRFKYPEEAKSQTSIGELALTYGLATQVDLIREVTLRQSVRLRMNFSEDRSLNDVLKFFVTPMHEFLSLATRRPNALQELVLSSRQHTVSTEGDNVYYAPIEVYYQRVYAEPRRDKQLLPDEMLFTLKDIVDDFGRILSRWLDVADELGTLCSLFFSTRDAPFMYAQQKFLNVAHAIEIYHRARYSQEVLSKVDHRAHLADIRSHLPKKYHRWLNEKLAHSNEPALRDRVLTLFDTAQEVMHGIAERDAFAKRIADTRNYHTHYNPRLKAKAATDGAALYYLTEKLSVLVEACLLAEMGINKNARLQMFHRNRHYNSATRTPL